MDPNQSQDQNLNPEPSSPPIPKMSPLPTQAVPSSSKKSGSLKTFFIVIALVLLGIFIGVLAARFFPMTNTAVTPPPPAPTVASGTPTFSPELTAEQDATLDLTAGWKTFQGTNINFTFKYPKNYSFSENNPFPNEKGHWFISVLSPLSQHEPKDTGLNSKELKIEFIIQPKAINDSLDKFFSEQARTDGNQMGPNSKTSIDGVEAIKLNWEGMGNGTSYYVLTETNRIIISKYPQISERDEEFNQILSTFKFTEAPRAPSSGGLDCQYKGKTYADGESFPDECNSCSCESGKIACTTMACL